MRFVKKLLHADQMIRANDNVHVYGEHRDALCDVRNITIIASFFGFSEDIATLISQEASISTTARPSSREEELAKALVIIDPAL